MSKKEKNVVRVPEFQSDLELLSAVLQNIGGVESIVENKDRLTKFVRALETVDRDATYNVLRTPTIKDEALVFFTCQDGVTEYRIDPEGNCYKAKVKEKKVIGFQQKSRVHGDLEQVTLGDFLRMYVMEVKKVLSKREPESLTEFNSLTNSLNRLQVLFQHVY